MTFIVQKRHNFILDQLDQEEAISIKDLSKMLNASRETIRKDIALLSKEGRLKQVRGGAIKVQASEAALSERTDVNPGGKEAIALAVAQLIPDGASLILDSGTTTLAAAVEIARRCKDISVCTNDVAVAEILAPIARETLLLGGVYYHAEKYTLGLDTLEMLGRYRADFSLVGVGGLSDAGLFTDFSREGVALRDRMIEVASRAFLLADFSKIGTLAPVRLTRSAQAERLITDKKPPDAVFDTLVEQGLIVQVA